MYRLNKTHCKATTFAEAEKNKIFSADVAYTERLNQSWYLTAMCFGIDPFNPPKMQKQVASIRKHPK